MHSRDSDSGQLNRYSLGIAKEADPFVVVVLEFFFFRVVGNVFTSNDDDAPFSNANDVHERTTPVGLLRVSSGIESGGVRSQPLSKGRLHGVVFSKKKNGGEIWKK